VLGDIQQRTAHRRSLKSSKAQQCRANDTPVSKPVSKAPYSKFLPGDGPHHTNLQTDKSPAATMRQAHLVPSVLPRPPGAHLDPSHHSHQKAYAYKASSLHSPARHLVVFSQQEPPDRPVASCHKAAGARRSQHSVTRPPGAHFRPSPTEHVPAGTRSLMQPQQLHW
jgi:hypothetical protein